VRQVCRWQSGRWRKVVGGVVGKGGGRVVREGLCVVPRHGHAPRGRRERRHNALVDIRSRALARHIRAEDAVSHAAAGYKPRNEIMFDNAAATVTKRTKAARTALPVNILR